MRWAKAYRDPYTDIKRTAAMSGPWRKKRKTDQTVTAVLLVVAFVALFVIAAASCLQNSCN